jgi:iron complex transport system substrate-binding protein
MRAFLLLIALVTFGAAAPVASAPKRIVSTSPSITETLFALGLGDRVVGVSRFCRYPPEAATLPKIGTFLKPDAELIARLLPDLVVVHAGPSGVERRLAGFGIPFVAVERDTLASAFQAIRVIGDAAGVSDRASELVASLETRLERVRAGATSDPPPRVLVVVGRRPGSLTDLVAAGRGSYLAELVAIAGGVNVLADEALPPYPRISMETVIRLEPDVILDAGDMGESPEDREQRRAATEALWKAQPLPAARSGQVHGVASDAFVVPGPRLAEAAETIAAWLREAKRP